MDLVFLTGLSMDLLDLQTQLRGIFFGGSPQTRIVI